MTLKFPRKRAKILLLCNNFPPEIGSAAQLFKELASMLSNAGYIVSVVTTHPRPYKTTSIKASLLRYLLPKIRQEKYNKTSILVLRVFPIGYTNNKVLLFLEHILEPLLLFIGSLAIGKHDLIIIYSPPFLLGFIGILLSKLWKAKIILNVQDPYPETAIYLNLISNSYLISLLYKLAQKIYESVHVVTVHSSVNKKMLLRYRISPFKVKVIPNWVNLESVDKLLNSSNLRSKLFKKYKANNEFLVTYAGIISVAQDLETIIRAAKLLEGVPDIKFLIVGEGVEKPKIVSLARALRARNVEFESFIPPEEYYNLLSISDVCIVPLKKNELPGIVPKKLLDIMITGTPVIAVVPYYSETANIIKRAKCGFVVEPGDYKSLSKAILKLYKNRKLGKNLGHAGRNFARIHFSSKSALYRYVELIESFINNQRVNRLKNKNLQM